LPTPLRHIYLISDPEVDILNTKLFILLLSRICSSEEEEFVVPGLAAGTNVMDDAIGPDYETSEEEEETKQGDRSSRSEKLKDICRPEETAVRGMAEVSNPDRSPDGLNEVPVSKAPLKKTTPEKGISTCRIETSPSQVPGLVADDDDEEESRDTSRQSPQSDDRQQLPEMSKIQSITKKIWVIRSYQSKTPSVIPKCAVLNEAVVFQSEIDYSQPILVAMVDQSVPKILLMPTENIPLLLLMEDDLKMI
jgi:hypothetical protein